MVEELATHMRFSSFSFHWKGRILRATGDALIIDGVVDPFDAELVAVALKWEIKDTGTISLRLMVRSSRERN